MGYSHFADTIADRLDIPRISKLESSDADDDTLAGLVVAERIQPFREHQGLTHLDHA